MPAKAVHLSPATEMSWGFLLYGTWTTTRAAPAKRTNTALPAGAKCANHMRAINVAAGKKSA